MGSSSSISSTTEPGRRSRAGTRSSSRSSVFSTPSRARANRACGAAATAPRCGSGGADTPGTARITANAPHTHHAAGATVNAAAAGEPQRHRHQRPAGCSGTCTCGRSPPRPSWIRTAPTATTGRPARRPRAPDPMSPRRTRTRRRCRPARVRAAAFRLDSRFLCRGSAPARLPRRALLGLVRFRSRAGEFERQLAGSGCSADLGRILSGLRADGSAPESSSTTSTSR